MNSEDTYTYYESNAAKSLRSGKEVSERPAPYKKVRPEKPNKGKISTEKEEVMEIDDEAERIMEIANQKDPEPEYIT
jgi:hypothetical protein